MVEIHGVQVADVSERPVHPVIIVIVFFAVAMAGMLIAQRRGWITQMNAALRGARSRVCRIFWFILTISLGIQLLAVLELWLVAKWLGTDWALSSIALGVTGGALASVNPVSLAGVGRAELGAGLLYAATGASVEEAIVLSTLLYLIKLLGALEGGVPEFSTISNLILRRRSPPAISM